MFFKKRRHGATRFVVLFHAQRQRLGAAHYEPGIEGRKNRTGAVLNKPDPIGVLFVVEHDDAADAIRVSVEILGGRMDHDIHSKFQRPL